MFCLLDQHHPSRLNERPRLDPVEIDTGRCCLTELVSSIPLHFMDAGMKRILENCRNPLAKNIVHSDPDSGIYRERKPDLG